ncbi:MAG TPA: DedA family protein, partial [Micromonosporaceae bacterium]|nr:DedA family protein [Micromonosporaceae bacterium]
MHDAVMLLRDLPPVMIYLLAATVVAGETALIIGLLAPGEATLVLVGFLAYAGTLELGPTIAVMVAAAVLGDALAFRAGRRYGPRLRSSGWGKRVGEERWRRADAMLHRLGGRGVLGARWVAFARTLVPRLAGAASMPYRRFAVWNLAGVASWVGGSVLVGYLAGESYETVSDYLGRATGAVLALLVAILAIVLIGRWLGRNPDPVRTLLTRARAVPPLRWIYSRYEVVFFLLSMRVGPGWTLLINVTSGLVLLFLLGLALALVLRTLVRSSGLAVVDEAIAAWIAEQRTSGMVDAAHAGISVLRGWFLIIAVAAVALALGWRARAWRDDLVGVVGTVGAFLPLVVLAAVADLTGQDRSADPAAMTLFPSQNTLVTASLCTL